MARAFRSVLLVLLVPLIAAGAANAGTVAAVPAPVNVLQDCWTTDLDADSDVEKELYTFAHDDLIYFVWKHKLMINCSNYRLRLLAWNCIDGKPRFSPLQLFQEFALGPIDPDPFNPEPIFALAIPPGSLGAGRYDWSIVVECDDTNSAIRSMDGDVEDWCGVNAGLLPITNFPVVFGPEPSRLGDPDPGGSPPGRVPGEDGETRPWCFTVEEPPPPFDLCTPQDCGTFTDCSAGPEFCACFELYDDPGTGGCLGDAPCGVDCSAGGDADCGAGEVCIFNTCCGYPNCIPAACGATATESPFAPGVGLTNAGPR